MELLKEELLKQSYLHIDETVVQVLKEPDRKNTTNSYMWVYYSIKDINDTIEMYRINHLKVYKFKLVLVYKCIQKEFNTVQYK